MVLRRICAMVVAAPAVVGLAPPDPAPVIATIPCKAVWERPGPKQVVALINRTTLTLGPAKTTIPAGATIHFSVFAQNINPLPQPQATSDSFDYKLTTTIRQGETWTYPVDILVSWDACATIAKWTEFRPDLRDTKVHVPPPAASGPLSGTGEDGAGAAIPHR